MNNQGFQLQPGSVTQLAQFAEGGYLYAIVDACDAPMIQRMIQNLGPQGSTSLFHGMPEEQHWDIAPYLLKVDSPLLQAMAEALFADPWGIFLMSRATPQELFEHFRRFLVGQLPDGHRFYCRFYDPRLLKQFLSASDPQDVVEFFGPVRAFGITQEKEVSFFMLAQ